MGNGASIPARSSPNGSQGCGCRKHYLGTQLDISFFERELLISFFVYGPTLTRRVLKCYRMYDHFSTKYDFIRPSV